MQPEVGRPVQDAAADPVASVDLDFGAAWLREGEPPLLCDFADVEAERRFVVDVTARAAAREVALGEVAVFCARTADVKAMLARFKQRRIAAQDLTAYKVERRAR